jgi:cell wall assembly regulator SMI1
MTESWTRIERWLESNAPRLRASLCEGAGAGTFDRIEVLGAPLSLASRSLHGGHDGIDNKQNVGSLFFGLDFLSIERGLRRRDVLPVASWLPIGHDGSRMYLVIDLGAAGQPVRMWDGDLLRVHDVAPDVPTLLDTFASDLEMGAYRLSPDALDDGTEFLEPAFDLASRIGEGTELMV